MFNWFKNLFKRKEYTYYARITTFTAEDEKKDSFLVNFDCKFRPDQLHFADVAQWYSRRLDLVCKVEWLQFQGRFK